MLRLGLIAIFAVTFATSAIAKPKDTPGAADPTNAGSPPGAIVGGVCRGPAC